MYALIEDIMHHSFSLLPLFAAFSASFPAPQPLNPRDPSAAPCTGDMTQDLPPSNNYIIQPNQWGVGSAVGSHFQCVAAQVAPSSNAVAWSTTFDWQGGADIKSYANALLPSIGTTGQCKAMSSFKNITSQWTWRYALTFRITQPNIQPPLTK